MSVTRYETWAVVTVVRDKKLGWKWESVEDPTALALAGIDWDFWSKMPRRLRKLLLAKTAPGDLIALICDKRPVRFWHFSSRGYRWRLRVLSIIRVDRKEWVQC